MKKLLFLVFIIITSNVGLGREVDIADLTAIKAEQVEEGVYLPYPSEFCATVAEKIDNSQLLEHAVDLDIRRCTYHGDAVTMKPVGEESIAFFVHWIGNGNQARCLEKFYKPGSSFVQCETKDGNNWRAYSRFFKRKIAAGVRPIRS